MCLCVQCKVIFNDSGGDDDDEKKMFLCGVFSPAFVKFEFFALKLLFNVVYVSKDKRCY